MRVGLTPNHAAEARSPPFMLKGTKNVNCIINPIRNSATLAVLRQKFRNTIRNIRNRSAGVLWRVSLLFICT